MATKILAYANLKGGVGKSHMVYAVAAELASRGKHILVIDGDPQGNTTNNFSLKSAKDLVSFRGTEKIFEEDMQAGHLILKGLIKEFPNMHLIPANITLTKTEIDIVSRTNREKIIGKWMRKNKDILSNYEYIIIDTNPSLSLLNQNFFYVADNIVAVVEPSSNSLDGVEIFKKYWDAILEDLMEEETESNIKGLMINKFRIQLKSHKEFVEYIKTHKDFKDLVLETKIPLLDAFTKAEATRKSVNLLDKNSQASLAIKNIVDEMIKKGMI